MSRVIPYTPRNVRGRAVLNSRDTFWLPEWVVSRMHHVRGFKGRRIRTRRCIEWVRSRAVAQRRWGKEGRSIAAKWLRELPWLFLRMEPSFFRQLNRVGSEPKRVEGENVRLSGSRAESRRSNFIGGRGIPSVRRLVRPSTSIFTGASMHFNGVLIWQMHSAHFGPRASLSISISFSLSIRYLSSLAFAADSLVSSLSLSFWRKPVDGANFFHREQPGLVKVDPFQVKKPIFFFFFFGNESLFHWTFSGVSFFLFFCFCLMYRIKVV